MITGICGFRSLVYENGAWRSSSRRSFIWDSPVVWASCKKHPPCPKDNEGRIIIRQSCTCGIHATLWDDELREYMEHPLGVGMLVESLGWKELKIDGQICAHTWAHTHGFTSTGVMVVGIINLTELAEEYGFWTADRENAERKVSAKQFAMKHAAEFFNCEIMDYQTARIITQVMWEKHGLEWPREIPKI